MPWEKKYDETKVLDSVMHAFWSHGYEATSMRDIVEASGLNRGSIYAAFTDKRTLFIATLRHYDKTYRTDFLARMARSGNAKEAIIATFAEAACGAGKDERPGGCLLVNTLLELSPHDPEIREIVDGSIMAVEDFFRTMIAAGQAEGIITDRLDPGQGAGSLLALFLGLRVVTRTKPRQTVIDAIASQVRTMLEP
ncbi:TetR/AcrR family transcriptional regulator [Oceanibacterium hippocampi]|uniref:HTH-type transcriptional repressor ComR n=1 Tax=Oceanibacterium hippocampi TaxID=745714 RepID=A0A1Y5TB39_9PROT|nr:TetR/AcrR family transcriptional regulator [Oceanibacterium hippocampi]SLN56378.1 HTH-type transcriptional repressor ComR [Oceanibacterium hippocampi]